jgi:hypothetical protein
MSVEKFLKNNKEHLEEVIGESETYTKGFTGEVEDTEVHLTLTDQGREYEIYVTAESEDIEKAKETLQEIQEKLASKEDRNKTIATQSDNLWAEVELEIEPEKIRSL